MSISLPSDIVLGVANAADPQDYRAAVERLAQAKVEAAGAGDSALKAANEAAAGARLQSRGHWRRTLTLKLRD